MVWISPRAHLAGRSCDRQPRVGAIPGIPRKRVRQLSLRTVLHPHGPGQGYFLRHVLTCDLSYDYVKINAASPSLRVSQQMTL